MTEPMNKAAMLSAAISKIFKQYGEGAIWTIGDSPLPNVDVISTNALTLDAALGVGGIARGRMTEIYGPESSGKTTLALHIIANAQAAGGTAAIVDVEHALDLNYATKLGVDVKNLLVSQPDTGEQALEIVETLIRGGVDVVVLDSVAMLIPKAELEGEMSDMQIGAQARLMAKALRKLTAPAFDMNCALIMINQIRANIGSFRGPSEVTPGGKSLRYAASVRIDLRRIESLSDGSSSYGIKVLAKVVKNKLAPPNAEAQFNIYFARGIDKFSSLVDAAEEKGILVKSGSWIKYMGETIGQGKERVADKLRNDPALFAEISEKLCA